MNEFVQVCDFTYPKEDILNMESSVLLRLDFDLAQSTPLDFLQLFQTKVKLHEKAYTYARYILQGSLLDLSC